MGNELKIFVAIHKNAWTPKSFYCPIWLGERGRSWRGEGEYSDSDGINNIHKKNDNFCELTAAYWLWRNLPQNVDVVGIVQYRRFFGRRGFSNPIKRIFEKSDYEKLLSMAPVIVPKKRNYFIETIWSQYEHAHHLEDLIVVRKIISEKFPEFLDAFDKHMRGTKVHLFNMFVMKRAYFDEYCTWLFNVLFEAERRLDISQYSKYDQRVFGFLGERLLDVWLNKKEIPYVEAPVIFLGRQNWFKKGFNFLARKYGFKHKISPS